MCLRSNQNAIPPGPNPASDRERLLSLSLGIARSGFFVLDLRTDLVHVDASFWRMIGEASDGPSGSFEQLIHRVHPDDRDLMIADVAAVKRGQSHRAKLAVRLHHGRGDYRWVEFVGEPHEADASGIRSMLVIGQDITTRRAAELAAAEANLRRRLLFEQSTDGIVLLDAAMKASDANRAFAGMLGYSLPELMALHVWDWDAQWPNREDFLHRWPRAPDSPGTVETLHRRKDGTIFPVEVSWQPTEWMGRQLTYCVCRDITERRRAEEERLQLVTIVEASSDLIAISDAIGRITYINRAGRTMLGIPRDRLLEKTYIRDYHPQWAYDIVARVGIPHAEKEGVWLGDTALRRQDDSELPVSQLIIVHKNRNGNVEFISTIARDITSRLETERQLREADRRKDEFLAMLAHELRNPLAPICNAVEILKDAGDSAAMITWCREVVQRQTEHLCRLVDDLLEVSRISRGKIVLKKRPTDVADVLQRAVETNRPVIHARRIELSVQSPVEPLWVDGDVVRLVQVVSNLLNNAAKYTRTGGEVRLSAARDGDRVIIRVTDTGQGIDPSALPHLFDLFYQADQTLDRSRGGLGIGLSLVKNLVELHGGRVRAYSEGRDRGSEFVVSLPVLTEPAAQPSPDEIEATRAVAKSRILIVDDNRDSAESMAVLLRQWGHDVLTAHDGHEGLKRAFSVRPDALLLDIGLPGLNGYEVCRQARLGGLDTALIIAVTGYADQGSLQQSQEAGFDAHLAKPVRLSLLQELLADHRPLTAPANPEAG